MEFHQISQSSWETNAAFWDEAVGQDGNKYWKVLQRPTLTRFITPAVPSSGGRALELAAGNGLCSRWLASPDGAGCASVLSTEGSAALIELARRRQSPDEAARITLQQLDVTDAAALAALAQQEPGGFDVVLINMAIQDIADINPLAQALPKLLKPDGIFVATLLHPVFFTAGVSRTIEINDGNSLNGPVVTRGKMVREYLDVPPILGVAEFGQPAHQVYFHRPIHELFATFFRAGLAMDAIEEPAFTEADKTDAVENHTNFTQLPALLAFRMRRLS